MNVRSCWHHEGIFFSLKDGPPALYPPPPCPLLVHPLAYASAGMPWPGEACPTGVSPGRPCARVWRGGGGSSCGPGLLGYGAPAVHRVRRGRGGPPLALCHGTDPGSRGTTPSPSPPPPPPLPLTRAPPPLRMRMGPAVSALRMCRGSCSTCVWARCGRHVDVRAFSPSRRRRGAVQEPQIFLR